MAEKEVNIDLRGTCDTCNHTTKTLEESPCNQCTKIIRMSQYSITAKAQIEAMVKDNSVMEAAVKDVATDLGKEV